MLSSDSAGNGTCRGLTQWIRSILVFEEGIYALLSLVQRRVPHLQLDVLLRCITTLVRLDWAQQDRIRCQYGFYFFESGHGGIRPLEVFGAPEEAIKG